MKKQFILLALVVAIAFSAVSINSFAEEQGIPKGKQEGVPYHAGQDRNPAGEPRGMMKEMKDFDLSENQIDKIKEIMLDFQKETLTLRNQIQMKQLELQELMMESSVDMEKVRAKLEEIASLQVDVKIKAIENKSNIKEVLTAEQLEKLSSDFPMPKLDMGNFQSNRGMRGRQW